ncbi:MAG: dihydropteroate synthase [Phycisphaerales bacterium]
MVLDRPRLVAILNLTPDSFYDGGRLGTVEEAVRAAERAVADGADVLDLGGESTRPGAQRVGPEEQVRRIVPVIGAIRARGGAAGDIPISVDTTLAPVARAALDAGADAINDVSAGAEDAGMFGLAAQRSAGLILMHRLRPPERDSYSDRYAEPPRYGDVAAEVSAFLRERCAAAGARGVAPGSIVIDPGLGFGKTVEQNLELIRRTGELAALGYPVLSGLSRKSFTGRAAGLAESTPAERLGATLALSVAHLIAGARLFRVHDVAEHRRAVSAAGGGGGGAPAGPDRPPPASGPARGREQP